MPNWKLLAIFSLTLTSAFGAIKGDGSSGMLAWGRDSVPFGTPTSYSEVMWFRAVAAPDTSNVQQVMSITGGAGPGALAELIWNHSAGFSPHVCSKETDFPLASIGSSLTGGVWYSIACVWDGTNMNAYVNGVLITASSSTASPGAGGIFTALGYFAGIDNFSNGTVAELAYYHNIALTPAEIKSLASGRNPTEVRKPSVYSPMWGVDYSNNAEADLSGALASAGTTSTCTFYTSGSVGHGGLTRVNHAPVGPYTSEEQGAY
jgi:hypothetical protein